MAQTPMETKLHNRCFFLGGWKGLPLWLGGAGLAGWVFTGEAHYNLALLLAAGGVWLAWLAGRGLGGVALLQGVLLSGLVLHFGWQLPQAQKVLSTPGYTRIQGIIRQQHTSPPRSGQPTVYLLGEVTYQHIFQGADGLPRTIPGRLAELEVSFQGIPPHWWGVRQRVHLGGPIQEARWKAGRLAVSLPDADLHYPAAPTQGWTGERIRLLLKERAGYYLGSQALAAYLPLVLGVKDRSTREGRRVVADFNRLGVSHLFAISGLHIAMLLVLFWSVGRMARGAALERRGWGGTPGPRQTGQGGTGGFSRLRVGVVLAVWGYIALIGFPPPAARAALMGSMVLAGGLWGVRTPSQGILVLAALVLLAWDPSLMYDLSFQLSFLAYFFVMAAIRLWGGWKAHLSRGKAGRSGPPRWSVRLAEGVGLSLWVTLLVTLGMGPVISSTFGKVSLLAFAANLLLVPTLSVVVLPSSLAALAASAVHLGGMPGGWVERITFGWLEMVLDGWIWLARLADGGNDWVWNVRVDWDSRQMGGYYLGVLALLWLAAPNHLAGLRPTCLLGRCPKPRKGARLP